jgi:hypothetical protein
MSGGEAQPLGSPGEAKGGHTVTMRQHPKAKPSTCGPMRRLSPSLAAPALWQPWVKSQRRRLVYLRANCRRVMGWKASNRILSLLRLPIPPLQQIELTFSL